MPLIFAAITPNDPRFALELAQKKDPKTGSRTYSALQELEGELYFMKPDTLVLLSSHGSAIPEMMNTNIASKVQTTWPNEIPELQSFKKECKCDVEFGAHIKEVVDRKEHDVPMTIVAESTLPPEVSAPMALLLAHLTETKVVTITTSTLPVQEHYLFGEFLEKQILQTNKRVAVIATGSLAPVGPTTTVDQQTFNKMYQDFVKTNQQEKLLRLNDTILTGSGSDLLNPFAVLMGVISKVNVAPEILSYEELHGYAQTVTNFVIK